MSFDTWCPHGMREGTGKCYECEKEQTEWDAKYKSRTGAVAPSRHSENELPTASPRQEANKRSGSKGVARESVRSTAWLEAAARMKDILWEEASSKHQVSPEDEGWNDDYHLELTVSVRELRAFGRAIAAASNVRMSHGANND